MGGQGVGTEKDEGGRMRAEEQSAANSGLKMGQEW